MTRKPKKFWIVGWGIGKAVGGIAYLSERSARKDMCEEDKLFVATEVLPRKKVKHEK
jgi:hypothetical protein